MGKVSIARFVAAPPKRVFEIASDFERAAGRITSIKSLEVLTGGLIRKGTRFRVTRSALGHEVAVEMAVTAFDQPMSFQVGCTCNGSWYEVRWRFDPDGTGTNLVMEFGWKAITLSAKLMSPLLDAKIKKCLKACDQDLDELKYAAEQPVAKAA